VQRAGGADDAVPTTRERVLASIVQALGAAGVEFLAPLARLGRRRRGRQAAAVSCVRPRRR